MKKRRNPNNNRIIARGPETIPRTGTRAWYEYVAGKRFYESPLPGQYFPEGATQKQLDELAIQRKNELAREAVCQVIADMVMVVNSAPEGESEIPPVVASVAA